MQARSRWAQYGAAPSPSGWRRWLHGHSCSCSTFYYFSQLRLILLPFLLLIVLTAQSHCACCSQGQCHILHEWHRRANFRQCCGCSSYSIYIAYIHSIYAPNPIPILVFVRQRWHCISRLFISLLPQHTHTRTSRSFNTHCKWNCRPGMFLEYPHGQKIIWYRQWLD